MSIDIIFDFNKRHYLPNDVIQAGKYITTIGKNLVEYGVGLQVSKVNHQSFDGYGNVFVELFDTNANRFKLLTLIFNTDANTLHLVPDRKTVNKSQETERTLDWILDFCKKHSESGAINCFSRIISTTLTQPGEYYVYRHLFNNGRIYIGKGKGSRYKVKSRRTHAYTKTLEEVGDPIIEKLCDEISEDSAYKIECDLIKELRIHYGYSFIINRTDGMEKANDIGDMPLATLQTMLRLEKIKIEDPRFSQTVNIFKRYTPEVGSAKHYYKSIDIYNAAKILLCSMNEIIRAKESSGVVINGFCILSDIEIDREIAKP